MGEKERAKNFPTDAFDWNPPHNLPPPPAGGRTDPGAKGAGNPGRRFGPAMILRIGIPAIVAVSIAVYAALIAWGYWHLPA